MNVEKAFNELALKIYEKIKSGEIVPNEEGTDGVKPGKGFAMKPLGQAGPGSPNPNGPQSQTLTKDKVTGGPVTCKDNCGC